MWMVAAHGRDGSMGDVMEWGWEDNVALFGGLLHFYILDLFHIVTIWLLQRGFLCLFVVLFIAET